MEWLKLLEELVFNILKGILQDMLEVRCNVTSSASEMCQRWITLALTKFLREKSACGDPILLLDILETRRKLMKPSRMVDGSIVVMSARSTRMEESPSSIESRISSSYLKVNTLLQKSLRMFTCSLHSWPNAGSMEIPSETTPSAFSSWMKCTWRSIALRTIANSMMILWKMKHWEWKCIKT